MTLARSTIIRNTGIVSLLGSNGSAFVVRFPVIEGLVMAVSHVIWSTKTAGGVSAALEHNLDAGAPSSLLDMVSRDDLWGLVHFDESGVAVVPFDPPFRIVGRQLAIYRNDGGATADVNGAIHWTWERVSSVEWTEIHRRTSRETA